MHLLYSFRIESGSRLVTASTAAPPCGAYLLILDTRRRIPTARAVSSPHHRRHPHSSSRSAAADALLPYSGTALRCIPTPISSPGRGPGLTENGSALRTTPPNSRSSASPKRIGMDIRHTPTHSPLTLRVSGVTENSAFPTRLRLTLTLSHASASHSLTSLPQPTAHRRCAIL